jgi:hypothetical protein
VRNNRRLEKTVNKELHNLHASPDINRMVKSRRIRWTEHVTRIREKRNAYGIFVGKPKGKNH